MKFEAFGREIEFHPPVYGVTQVLTSAAPDLAHGPGSVHRLPAAGTDEHRAYWTWALCGHLFASVFSIWPTDSDAQICSAADTAHRRLVAYVDGLLAAGMRPDAMSTPLWVGEIVDGGPMPVPGEAAAFRVEDRH